MAASPESVRTKIHVIDGTALLYRFWFASGERGDDGALRGLLAWVLGFLERVRPPLLALVFDPAGKTFRHDVSKTYKASRNAPPPLLASQLDRAQGIAEAVGIAAFRVEGFEADDLMATIATRGLRAGLSVVLVSPDKDILQLLGEDVVQMDPKTFLTQGPRDVLTRFGVGPEQLVDVMALAGDASDDVEGVPGIGHKTATAVIAELRSLDAALADLDRVANLPGRGMKRVARLLEEHADRALLSRRLVRLRTDVPLPKPLALKDFRFRGRSRNSSAALAGLLTRDQERRLETLEVSANVAKRRPLGP